MIIERARQLRAKIETIAAGWTDEVALDYKEFYPQWAIGHDYTAGDNPDRVRDLGELYKCKQSHKSQSDWQPHITPALWVHVSIEEWPEWDPLVAAVDTYKFGAKVSHNGKHWISDYEYNSWEPGVFGWHEAE